MSAFLKDGGTDAPLASRPPALSSFPSPHRALLDPGRRPSARQQVAKRHRVLRSALPERGGALSRRRVLAEERPERSARLDAHVVDRSTDALPEGLEQRPVAAQELGNRETRLLVLVLLGHQDHEA